MKAIGDITSVYFLGIGGIGMSALAKYFLEKGLKVSGYDRMATDITRQLQSMKVDISFDDDPSTLPSEIDLVIYTPAVPSNTSLFRHFSEGGYSMKKRSEVLGLISSAHRTIAIGGTHGKTTTSAILTHLLFDAGLPVTGFVGGIMTNYGSNYLHNGSDIMVVEADEFDRSFLTLDPVTAVVLSMDADHLDIYGRDEQVTLGFKQFIQRTQPGGTVFLKSNLRPKFNLDEWQLLNTRYKCYLFGDPKADIYADNIRYSADGTTQFDFHHKTKLYRNINFAMPGIHNVSNATVAMAIALDAGIQAEQVRASMKNFKGVKRRFEYIVLSESNIYIDDYAHHPEELRQVIRTAKSIFPEKTITGIFQPHLYSRTRDFAEDFAAALDELDIPVLIDIYPAREEPIASITSQTIYDLMQNTSKLYIAKEKVADFVKRNRPQLLLTLGAGDIDTLVKPLKEIMS